MAGLSGVRRGVAKAMAMREEAVGWLERGERKRARGLLSKALSLFEQAGATKEAVECRLALGLTYLRVEGEEGRQKARRHLAEAARGALGIPDEGLYLKCLSYLCETAFDGAGLEVLEATVEAGKPFLSAEGRVMAERWRDGARSVVALVERSGVVDEGLLDALSDPATVSGMALLREHLPSGYSRLLDSALAHQRGDIEAAEREAMAAREAALDTVDPVLYILACGAVARARDERGDRVGALTILFTCKASIEDLLGPEAGAQVVAMIEALEARWGGAAFAEVLEAYRRQFA